jgi:hypothetical protein
LIAPVQVEGKWSYYWDRNGDGVGDLNGLNVALPTANVGLSYPNGIDNSQYGTTASSGDMSSFDDLLAIWDITSGASTGNQLNGLPFGWYGGVYASATPSANHHAAVALVNGTVLNYSDGNTTWVAVQVLPVVLDLNHDGVFDAGEVHTLAEAGISSIHLTSDGVARTPVAGVNEAGHTTATATDGSHVLLHKVAA